MTATPLWAPWRMEYILGGGAKVDGCLFCGFGERSPETLREALVLVVGEHAMVCLNRYPFTPSHLMVAPRRHVSDLNELDGAEYAALGELLRQSLARLRAAVRPEGVNVGYNLGRAAGAGIADHVHAHLVPRWSGDTNFMPVLADVRVMPEHLDEAWQRLYPYFSDLPGVRAPSP